MARALLKASCDWFGKSVTSELVEDDIGLLEVVRKMIKTYGRELEEGNLYAAFAIHVALFYTFKCRYAELDTNKVNDFDMHVRKGAGFKCDDEILSRLKENPLSDDFSSHWRGPKPSGLVRGGLEALSHGWPSDVDGILAVVIMLTHSESFRFLPMERLQELARGSRVLDEMNSKVVNYLNGNPAISLPSLCGALIVSAAQGGPYRVCLRCTIYRMPELEILNKESTEWTFPSTKDLKENLNLNPFLDKIALGCAGDMDEEDSEVEATLKERQAVNSTTEGPQVKDTAPGETSDREESKHDEDYAIAELAKSCLERTQSSAKNLERLPGRLTDYAYVKTFLVNPRALDSHWQGSDETYVEYEKRRIRNNMRICRTATSTNWLGELLIANTRAITLYHQSESLSEDRRHKAARMIMTFLANVEVASPPDKERKSSYLLLILSGTLHDHLCLAIANLL